MLLFELDSFLLDDELRLLDEIESSNIDSEDQALTGEFCDRIRLTLQIYR